MGARGEGAAARIDDPVSARGAETGETFGGDEGEICEGRHWACEQSTPTWNSEDKYPVRRGCGCVGTGGILSGATPEL